MYIISSPPVNLNVISRLLHFLTSLFILFFSFFLSPIIIFLYFLSLSLSPSLSTYLSLSLLLSLSPSLSLTLSFSLFLSLTHTHTLCLFLSIYLCLSLSLHHYQIRLPLFALQAKIDPRFILEGITTRTNRSVCF